jgi:hypothetical protein
MASQLTDPSEEYTGPSPLAPLIAIGLVVFLLEAVLGTIGFVLKRNKTAEEKERVGTIIRLCGIWIAIVGIGVSPLVVCRMLR